MIDLLGSPLYSPTLKSRAITAENPTGAPGSGGQAANGRKGRPCLPNLERGMTYTFADIPGAGAIRHIWITVPKRYPHMLRNLILRFYWDGQDTPSVESPLGDFFGVSHGRMASFENAFQAMPEGKAFNSYFYMPFAKQARLTVTNEAGEDLGMFFYQVDYTLGDPVDDDTPRFHARFRRTANTTLYQDFVVLDNVEGRGRFLGANIGIVDRYTGHDVWWGEGEVKIYLDDDSDFPTLCGTGSEDYACSGWGLGPFHARECGAPLVQGRYISFYRFHVSDPVYFSRRVKVTLQQIGNDGRVEPATAGGRLGEFVRKGEYKKDAEGGNYERVDDVCATAYWYQTLPTAPAKDFPDKPLRSHDL